MSRGKRKKKPTQSSEFWRQTFIGALVDFFIGLVLMLISRVLK